ncbi:hypothetical protein ACFL37_00945 [Candidatus Margulisiibacteriota bacterium]
MVSSLGSFMVPRGVMYGIGLFFGLLPQVSAMMAGKPDCAWIATITLLAYFAGRISHPVTEMNNVEETFYGREPGFHDIYWPSEPQ